jgi:DNA-binding MarR family transcriptional regulator
VADRTPNLLGALSLVVTDRMSDAIIDAGGGSHTAAAALSALHHFLRGPSIDLLRQVLGLTPSGTVRLVDRLEETGYIRRQPGRDGRSVTVVLTASGRRAAERVSKARAGVLEDALGTLSAGDRRMFSQLVSQLLVGLMREPGAVRWMCRLCDTQTCGHETGTCPVTRAAREKYKTTDQPKTNVPTA